MQTILESRAPSSPPLHTRYTLCGDEAAEARVAQDLSRITTGIDSELGEELRALLLVGAFARAEGGIVYLDGEPHAAAPGYRLLAVFRHRSERYDRKVDEIATSWSRILGTGVAIRAFSVHELAHVEATRFWFHAGRGWLITLLGDPALSLAIPRREPADLRYQEAALALCEGLTGLALCSLAPAARADAWVASLHRAVVACGDALLLRRGQYGDTLAARAEALAAMCAGAALRAAYRDAIAFAARPDAWHPESHDLASWSASLRRTIADTLVHAEGERLGSARNLLGLLDHDEPLFAAPRARRRSGVLRVLDSVPLLAGDRWRSHPIERLVRSSAALALATHVPECRARAAALLDVAGETPTDAELAGALRELAAHVLAASRLEQPFAALPDEGCTAV